MKKRNLTSIAFLTCLLLGACSSTVTPKTASAKDEAPVENKETQNPLLHEEDAKNDKNTTMQGNNLDGMEFDAQGDVTMEILIQQLISDGIVTGTPQELQDGVKGALRTTQIDSAIIVEYDAKNLTEFMQAYDAKRITLQGKEYPIIATNAQFVLVLLAEQDQEKAATSFQKRKNDDGRLIVF